MKKNKSSKINMMPETGAENEATESKSQKRMELKQGVAEYKSKGSVGKKTNYKGKCC